MLLVSKLLRGKPLDVKLVAAGWGGTMTLKQNLVFSFVTWKQDYTKTTEQILVKLGGSWATDTYSNLLEDLIEAGGSRSEEGFIWQRISTAYAIFWYWNIKHEEICWETVLYESSKWITTSIYLQWTQKYEGKISDRLTVHPPPLTDGVASLLTAYWETWASWKVQNKRIQSDQGGNMWLLNWAESSEQFHQSMNEVRREETSSAGMCCPVSTSIHTHTQFCMKNRYSRQYPLASSLYK